MITAPESTAQTVRDPRDLIPRELFTDLTSYVARHHEVTLSYAERVIEQTLVWLTACAQNPNLRLAMSDTVDPGWHAFILHSRDYVEFCERFFGRYVHHVPPAPGSFMDEAAVARTLPALRATGFAVCEEHWTGSGYPCCPPDPCVC